ncbi:MAG TPA: hypothetical protein VJ349_03360, partial [Stellaceae bacterium]|nr:hypothetical protein [Stellaceae bacterium]
MIKGPIPRLPVRRAVSSLPRRPQGGAARGLAEAVEGATWRWRYSARQSVRRLPPKTRARGSARRQARHKARVEPLARRLGQYAAIA